MKMNYILLLGIILLASYCKNNDDIIVDSYIPMTVGSYWNYQVYDSLQNKYDTINVSILNHYNKGGQSIFIWLFSNKNSMADTLFVVNSLDSISFFENNSLTRLKWKYFFPLEIGKSWSLTKTDNYTVESQEKIDGFPDSYKIVRNVQSFNYVNKETTWISPGIGFVKLDFFVLDLGPFKNESWSLLNYNIEK